MPVEVVWHLVLIQVSLKAYKICHFVGLKKKKSNYYTLRFLRKAPTNNNYSNKNQVNFSIAAKVAML